MVKFPKGWNAVVFGEEKKILVFDVFTESAPRHSVKTDDWPMMSQPKDVLNVSYVFYQHLSEYVGLWNIKEGLYCEPALKKHYLALLRISKHYLSIFHLQFHSALQQDILSENWSITKYSCAHFF